LKGGSPLEILEPLAREVVERRTIAIAYQLGTVNKTDIIFAFDNIRVAESGSNDELTSLDGKYSCVW
jgi:ABC-type transport system involved in Fe-S cluster assembly fused permease/ATPase subunit